MHKTILGVILVILAGCRAKENNELDFAVQLDRYFATAISPDQPGAAVQLVIDDSIVFSRGYGLADLETREPITPRTLFNVGSLSKTFVATAILQLNNRGLLTLEDSLSKYFPDFRDPDIANKIKIKHLLTHTSGLPDNRNVAADTAFYLTAKDSANWYPETQVGQLHFAPGSQFEYSNPAFNGLALIVEQVAKEPWQEYIESAIFKPAGMKTSTITNGDHPKTGVSHGYVLNHGRWIEDDYGEEPTFPAAGNGGVWSSVEELGAYEKAFQQAVILPAETVEDARTVKEFDNWEGTLLPEADWSWFRTTSRAQVVGGKVHYRPFVGWSWFIDTLPDGTKIIGHTGTQGGFLCNYVSIPEKRIFFVILTNAPLDIYAFSERIMQLLGLA